MEVDDVGFFRLVTILTDDVNRVAQAAIAIPLIIVATVAIIGMLGYLAILNMFIFFLVTGTIFLVVFDLISKVTIQNRV